MANITHKAIAESTEFHYHSFNVTFTSAVSSVDSLSITFSLCTFVKHILDPLEVSVEEQAVAINKAIRTGIIDVFGASSSLIVSISLTQLG